MSFKIFIYCLKKMCQPFSNNRITPEKALSKLDVLKVHSNNNKKNLTKKKKSKKTKK